MAGEANVDLTGIEALERRAMVIDLIHPHAAIDERLEVAIDGAISPADIGDPHLVFGFRGITAQTAEHIVDFSVTAEGRDDKITRVVARHGNCGRDAVEAAGPVRDDVDKALWFLYVHAGIIGRVCRRRKGESDEAGGSCGVDYRRRIGVGERNRADLRP
jgi:hypothetical protein